MVVAGTGRERVFVSARVRVCVFGRRIAIALLCEPRPTGLSTAITAQTHTRTHKTREIYELTRAPAAPAPAAAAAAGCTLYRSTRRRAHATTTPALFMMAFGGGGVFRLARQTGKLVRITRETGGLEGGL